MRKCWLRLTGGMPLVTAPSQRHHDQKSLRTPGHDTRPPRTPDELTINLLRISASPNYVVHGVNKGEDEKRQLRPASSGDMASQTLRTLLLSCRKKTAQTLHVEIETPPEVCTPCGPPLEAYQPAETWYVAFQHFSHAVQRHAVVPTIAHINVLLGITVRGCLWQQKVEVENFVERFLDSAHGLYTEGIKASKERQCAETRNDKCTTSSIQEVISSMQPTVETYEWLMEAAVRQRCWKVALEHFDDAREACLPVTDTSLRLALLAYRMAGVYSVLGVSRTAPPSTALIPLRTNQRGPQLRSQAAPAISLSTNAAPRKFPEERRVWEVALTLFESYKHRVCGGQTVGLIMALMAEAGKHNRVLRIYRECHGVIPLDTDAYYAVSKSAREAGDWVFSLSLLQELSFDDGALQQHVLEDAVRSLRRTGHYKEILHLSAQLSAEFWTPGARVMLSQAALMERELLLLLTLVMEGFGKNTDSTTPQCGTSSTAGLQSAPVLVAGTYSIGGVAADAGVDASVPVEVFDVALRAIQVELAHRHRPASVDDINNNSSGECDAAKCSTVINPCSRHWTALGSRHCQLQNLASLSVAVYERFLQTSMHQIRLKKRNVFSPDSNLSIYAPFMNILEDLSHNEIHCTSSGCGSHDLFDSAPWRLALAQMSMIRRPDALVVSLAANILQMEQQWEFAFKLLHHASQSEYEARIAASKARSGRRVGDSASSGPLGPQRHSCTVVSAASVRCAVLSAIACQPKAAVQLVQYALSCGWIDSAMALQLLELVRNAVKVEHRHPFNNGCRSKPTSHAHASTGLDEIHPQSHDTTDFLIDLVSLWKQCGRIVWPLLPMYHEVLSFLRQGPHTAPSTASLCTIRSSLQNVVNCLSTGWDVDRREDVELVLVAVVHAIVQHVGSSTLNRWALWHECLCLLQLFRSPILQRPYSSSVLEANEATFRVVRAFVSNCDRPEEAFVEGVVFDWLLGCDAMKSLPLDGYMTMLTLSSRNTSCTTWLSLDLMLHAFVWASRHRTKRLVRRFAKLLCPLCQQLLLSIGTRKADAKGELLFKLRSDALATAVVAVQCLTSGLHEEVLRDWSLVRELLDMLINVSELVTPGSGGRSGTSVLADVLAAVFDKLRRSFHHLITKMSLDLHRQRWHYNGDPAAGARHSDKCSVTYGKSDFTGAVEAGALSFMDICETFLGRVISVPKSDSPDRNGVEICLEKSINCIWDINYSLYVWCSLFSGYSEKTSSAMIRLLQKRYRRTLHLQLSFSPAHYTMTLRLQRWLVVMSSDGQFYDANRTQTGTRVEELCGSLINDLTTLDTWQSCCTTVIVEGGPNRKFTGKTQLRSVILQILEAIHTITIQVAERAQTYKPRHAAPRTKSRNSLAPLPDGFPARFSFEEPLSTVRTQQLHVMQRAGSGIAYMMLCEGSVDALQVMRWLMAWYFCPSAVFSAALRVAQLVSPDRVGPAWSSASVVTALELLRVQSRLQGAKTALPRRPSEGSHAFFILSSLTNSPSIRAVTRVDEEVFTAVLLALEPDDVEDSADARHVVCRLLMAFPKMIENRMILMLLNGALDATQLRVLDALVGHISEEFGRHFSSQSPALMRGVAMWKLLRPPRDKWFSVRGNVTKEVSSSMEAQVFSQAMFSVDSGDLTSQKLRLQNITPDVERPYKDFTRLALRWERALMLLHTVHNTDSPAPVNIGDVCLYILEAYSACIPTAEKRMFAEELLKDEKRCKGGLEGKSQMETIVWDLAKQISQWESFLLREPMDPVRVHQAGLDIWPALLALEGEATGPPPDNVWKSVRNLLCDKLRNRPTSVASRLTHRGEPSEISFSCAVVRNVAVHLLRHGVLEAPLLRGGLDVATVVSSLLLLLELVTHGTAVHLVLYGLHHSIREDGDVLRGMTSDNSGAHNAWYNVLECTVFLLTLPGFLDVGREDTCCSATTDAEGNISIAQALSKLLLHYTCCYAARYVPLRTGTVCSEEDAVQGELLRLTELCGRHIVLCAKEMVLVSSTARDHALANDISELEDVVRCFVQATLLLGAWRDIYWLAAELLSNIRPSSSNSDQETEPLSYYHPWRWVIGLLPAMIAASARTCSSIQQHIVKVIEKVPVGLLRQLPCAMTPGTSSPVEGAERGRRFLSNLLMKLKQNICLRTEGVLREHGRSMPFVSRLFFVKPLIELGVVLEVWKEDSVQPGSMTAALLFFLSGEQVQLLQKAALMSNGSEVSSPQRMFAKSRPLCMKSMNWEKAIDLLSRTSREEFRDLLERSNFSDVSAATTLQDALCIFHSSCLAELVSWRTAIRFFCMQNGLPHIPRVVPAFITEWVVEWCSSWKLALHALRHSLSTVPRPTRVQQLLAYLVLHRMRTDVAWVERGDDGAVSHKPSGKALLSWETACWCYGHLTRGGKGSFALPQRTMTEILRHCVLNPEVTLLMYEVYWAQGYRRIEGVNCFLSLLRAARYANSEALALRAMWDYIERCDEWDSTQNGTQGATVKCHVVTSQGNRMLCHAFAGVCSRGVVSQDAAMAVAAALRRRGCIGEVEELLLGFKRGEGRSPVKK
uniref:WGS project CAEQ00000000 data, annotated contig 309 n=1 Tax=Trypanosoma congolense (strain IL3000) TaxID=1068625 RepID=F9WES5_TRYCI|nr:unnamed protein product [Trypanosoma congolense IL3000]